MKKLIVDLDGTLTIESDSDYLHKTPNSNVVEQCRQYKKKGYIIVISTARNMRTFDGNIGKINIHTLPTVIEWLEKHKVPFDEIHVGKPWCGFDGFYIDDRAIRPSEFVSLNEQEIADLLAEEKRILLGS